MKLNERIKELRKLLKLSQEEFGNRIGIIKSSISRIESGANNPSEQTLKLICKEFNVNYLWLIDGEGEMFLCLPDTLIDEIALEYNLDDEETILVKEFLALDPNERKGVCSFMKNIAKAYNNLAE